jgi:hypothetical protein
MKKLLLFASILLITIGSQSFSPAAAQRQTEARKMQARFVIPFCRPVRESLRRRRRVTCKAYGREEFALLTGIITRYGGMICVR